MGHALLTKPLIHGKQNLEVRALPANPSTQIFPLADAQACWFLGIRVTLFNFC